MTTSHTSETRIVADPDVPLVRIEREFAAPVEALFRAHVEPELVVRWLGPRQRRMELDVWDCRTGGAWRYRLIGAGDEQAFRGSFHEVRPGELIVQTFSWEGLPDAVALERMVFEDLGGGRARLRGTSLVDSFIGRDEFVASGMESGVRESYDRLDELTRDLAR